MRCFFFTACLALSISLSAAYFRNEGNVYYPAQGVIRPDEGTIEVTVLPQKPLSGNWEGWPFAFCLRGRVFTPQTRTVLGIYVPPRAKVDDPSSVFGLTRTVQGTRTAIQRGPDAPAGKPVNYALSYGKAGLQLYCNGKLVAQSSFPGALQPFAPFIRLHDSAPFYPQRLKISAVQLPPEKLGADPGKPFSADTECTLLANTLDTPQFFAAPAMRKNVPVSVAPFHPMEETVLRENEPVQMPFCVNNLTGETKKFFLDLAITAPYNKSFAPRRIRTELELPPQTVQQIRKVAFGRLPAGFYKVRCSGGYEYSLSVLPAEQLAKEGNLADFIGLSLERNAEIFKRMDIRSVRAWNMHMLLWYQLEPQKGHWDFRDADRLVEAFHKRGIKLLGTLGYPPEWAGVRPDINKANAHLYNTTPGTWKPRSAAEWENYIRTVADRYRGKVNAYEIWNEVDWHPPMRAASFTGTTQDYFNLLRTASKAIRKTDPGAKIAVSGFGTGASGDENMHRDLVKMGAADLVDIWNMHAYEIKAKAPLYRDTVRAARPGMPIWQTEFMWHVLEDRTRQAYLGPAIHCWYLEMDYTKFFSFGQEGYLTDDQTNSLYEPLHTIAVHQSFLRNCDAFCGRIPGLPESDFDVAYSFRRSDGKYLSMAGSSSGSYRLHIANPVLALRDMYGTHLTHSGNTLLLEGKFLYIVTEKPLQVLSFTALEREQLLPNSGFEELGGDAMNGIDKCHFNVWQLRTRRDPKGKIGISPAPIAGKYSAELSSSGKEVYCFASVRLPNPGIYRMSALVRTLSGEPKVFLRLFEQKERGWLKDRFFVAPKIGETREIHFDVEVDKSPDVTVAAIIGISGQGNVLVDEVKMVPFSRLLFDDDDAAMLPMPDTAAKFTRSDKAVIDLGATSPLGTGKKYFGGVPFDLRKGALTAAGKDWKSTADCSLIRFAPVRGGELHLLGGVMYQPSDAKETAELTIHYTDGACAAVKISFPDWFLPGHPELKPAVRWEAPVTSLEYGFFSCTVQNPHPEKALAGLSLKSLTSGITAIKAVTMHRSADGNILFAGNSCKSSPVCWGISGVKGTTSFANGTLNLTIRENTLCKNSGDGQCWIPVPLTLKKGSRYRLDFCLNASADCDVSLVILVCGKVQTSYNIHLKKGEERRISQTFTARSGLTGKGRLPNLCFGKVPAGTMLQLSHILFTELK